MDSRTLGKKFGRHFEVESDSESSLQDEGSSMGFFSSEHTEERTVHGFLLKGTRGIHFLLFFLSLFLNIVSDTNFSENLKPFPTKQF